MVAHGESEQLRNSPIHEASVNPDVFHERPLPPTVTDRVAERTEKGPDTDLTYARQQATETANIFLLRGSQITPAEFKVMGGVLDLGVKTNAWTAENYQQIKECLEARAGQQQNSLAAHGLRNMADKLTQFI